MLGPHAHESLGRVPMTFITGSPIVRLIPRSVSSIHTLYRVNRNGPEGFVGPVPAPHEVPVEEDGDFSGSFPD
jgi:hypothetical protein